MEEHSLEKKFNKIITIVSILIPTVVGILFAVKLKDFGINVEPLSFLPPIYATTNGITAVVLVLAVIAIKNGKQKLHQRLMTFAIALSLAFLVMYVAYHMTAESVKLGDLNHDGIVDAVEKAKVGTVRFLYYFILGTHIILSVAIIPLVLISYVRALGQRFDRHRKIARITFPLWLYVAVTGVIVYLMISPYYA
ncbi:MULTISPECIES: DUF420 domain-containing protein [Flavobacterium]|uniref:DUF420 domain-containing protein n=1 Tax=Flavobacterium salmonis TaxID=2654844 RepID=A0A6V6YTV4_9FLAO|nr:MULTISPECIES: DUF420 domain-containing protein [Flavobacterium]OOV20014.1 hypothetical protein BXU10_10440 [Flavobacterium sp. LM4]CAD0002719.1 hypothetical protein FLAT13_01344 [Flavobacterium salmonis]